MVWSEINVMGGASFLSLFDLRLQQLDPLREALRLWTGPPAMCFRPCMIRISCIQPIQLAACFVMLSVARF